MDGKYGIIVMYLNCNGLFVNKVWIFIDEFILCLGSNIYIDSIVILIIFIDQCFKKGEVWLEGNCWYFYDNIGYIFL